MSRHTLNDGVITDERIIKGRNYDAHWPILGPSPKLIGAYKREEIRWSEFHSRYVQELHEPLADAKGNFIKDKEGKEKLGKKAMAVKKLADLAMKQHVTILCIEESHSQCHRRLLADACLKYQPTLSITHRR